MYIVRGRAQMVLQIAVVQLATGPIAFRSHVQPLFDDGRPARQREPPNVIALDETETRGGPCALRARAPASRHDSR